MGEVFLNQHFGGRRGVQRRRPAACGGPTSSLSWGKATAGFNSFWVEGVRCAVTSRSSTGGMASSTLGGCWKSPGVFSQGTTLEELRENIQDAYDLMVTQERTPAPATAQQQPVGARRMKRQAFVRELGQAGCQLVRTASGTTCTVIRLTGGRHRCRAIERLHRRCVRRSASSSEFRSSNAEKGAVADRGPH